MRETHAWEIHGRPVADPIGDPWASTDENSWKTHGRSVGD